MRYPTRKGIAVSPYELGFVIPESSQKTTRHHAHFERCQYDLRHRSLFRNLISNVYPLLPYEHQDLHERFDAPKVPSDVLMIDHLDEYMALNGVLRCVKEKKTREVYRVQPEEWEFIKGLYRKGM